MKKRKVCVVTGSRAEYGLLAPLMREIRRTAGLELQVVATGMHLSPEFGLTYLEIEKDGFKINERVEMLLSNDSEAGVAKSTGLGMIGFADALRRLNPDLVVLLGDRFEIFAAATSAHLLRIPIAHLHGGELTEGATDEALRHCITKLSQLHFTSTEQYRKRVIQLGEQPTSVYNVGAIGLDNIRSIKLFSKKELEKQLGFRFLKNNILVTFHPVTLENNSSEKQFSHLLSALYTLKDTFIIFTKPNADANGRVIIKLIDEFVAGNQNTTKAFTSMGQRNYLSMLNVVDAVVGNSSSGIIEVPSFKIGTVNIGDRQKGRIQALSVINCKPEKGAIIAAIQTALSEAFRKKIASVSNPYGDGRTAPKIVKIIKTAELKDILKKKFFDL